MQIKRITIISILIIQNPANEVMTYGYHRSEIIASLCSTLIVLVISIWIVADSIEIIRMPRQIDSLQMIIFSVIGLIFNLFMRYLKEIYPVPDSDDGKFFKNYTRKTELEAPLLNTNNLPLSGIYNDLDNIEEDKKIL